MAQDFWPRFIRESTLAFRGDLEATVQRKFKFRYLHGFCPPLKGQWLEDHVFDMWGSGEL